MALEDDTFVRKVITKGLLYFRGIVETKDSTSGLMMYSIVVDKSKAYHLEVYEPEDQHLMEEYNMKIGRFIKI